jgi:hypothetical protein
VHLFDVRFHIHAKSHQTFWTQIFLHCRIARFWSSCQFDSPLRPYMSQPHFEGSVKMRLTFPKVGTWSLRRLPQLQSSTLEDKTPCLEVFFIPLERPWSVDVENGLAWSIWTSVAQVIVKRRAGSQIGNLTLDHKKFGIDPIPVCADGVRHTVGKLLRRATSLLWTSSQSKVWVGSYEFPKSWESKSGQFRDSLGVPRIKAIRMQVRRSNVENTTWGKVVASPESKPWWVKWVRVAYGSSQHQGCFRRCTNPFVVGFGCRTE